MILQKFRFLSEGVVLNFVNTMKIYRRSWEYIPANATVASADTVNVLNSMMIVKGSVGGKSKRLKSVKELKYGYH